MAADRVYNQTCNGLDIISEGYPLKMAAGDGGVMAEEEERRTSSLAAIKNSMATLMAQSSVVYALNADSKQPYCYCAPSQML